MIYDYVEHSKAIATESLRQKDDETSDRKRPNRQKEPKSERQTLYAIIHPVALRIVGAFCTRAAESGKGCYGKWRPSLRQIDKYCRKFPLTKISLILGLYLYPSNIFGRKERERKKLGSHIFPPKTSSFIITQLNTSI